MRLDKVSIDGFKNLKQLEVDFDERQLTTVLIGQNGAGKSNLIEAITQVFRWVDLRRNEPRFRYRVAYRIQPLGHTVPEPPRVCLSNFPDEPAICVNGKEVKRTEFERRKAEWFPDLVFGYYSGGSRRLEALFDSHQRRYYDDIKLEDDEAKVAQAQVARRLFYCRPIHGVLALMALFAFPHKQVTAELADRLGITGFHSLLALFREPWFAKGKKAGADDLWGPGGPDGYPWLAFSWENFRLSAQRCNQINRDEDAHQTVGKGAWFPLMPNGMRATWCHRCIDDERPVLLDPTRIADVRLIEVTATGQMGASKFCLGEYERNRVSDSVKLLGLDLPGLRSARQRTMRLMQELLDQLQRTLSQAESGALASEFLATQLPIDGQLNQLRRLTRPSEPYAAAARAQLRISGFGDLCEPVEQMEAAA